MPNFQFPSWRQRLVRSLHINRSQPQSKYYQVASVSRDGLPKNRTLVFRGFVPESLNLISVTDVRSDKISDWKQSTPKKFEICWYFAGSREQYRIAGHVSLISNETLKSAAMRDPERKSAVLSQAFLNQQWGNLSSAAKEQFFWPNPKAPFDSSLEQQVQIKETNNESQVSNSAQSKSAESTFDISDNFCVVIFTPLSVDYLNLKHKPQLRCLSDFENDWLEIVVNA